MLETHHLVIGPQRLHAHLGGAAGARPTVVLEAGGGSTLEAWLEIEQALAPQVQVLSYERAGIGESSGPVDSVSAQAVSRRLEALLAKADIRGPLILVGHSLGGLYMRYFAATRPDRVAGLVLLDATPEDLPFPRFYRLKPALLAWLLHGLIRIRLLPWLIKHLTPPEKQTARAQAQLAALGSFRHVRTVLREIAALRDIQAEIAALPPAAPIPTLTLSAGQHDARITADQIERFRRSHQQLAAQGLPPHSHHHRMAGASHMSLLTDPVQAAAAASLILDFAQQITSSPPA